MLKAVSVLPVKTIFKVIICEEIAHDFPTVSGVFCFSLFMVVLLPLEIETAEVRKAAMVRKVP